MVRYTVIALGLVVLCGATASAAQERLETQTTIENDAGAAAGTQDGTQTAADSAENDASILDKAGAITADVGDAAVDLGSKALDAAGDAAAAVGDAVTDVLGLASEEAAAVPDKTDTK